MRERGREMRVTAGIGSTGTSLDLETGAPMKIIVNGEETAISSMSVHEYLRMLDVDPRPLAVELNREILPKKDYKTTMLAEGDRMEIIWFVGGG